MNANTYELGEAIALLERTPRVLDAWLRDLPEPWLRANEGERTFSAFDVVGHLVHGERADWLTRVRCILEHGEARTFVPFDRFAQERESLGKSVPQLLDEFAAARADSLRELRALDLSEADYARRGTHPKFGSVTLRQLLSTWVAHDLDHLAQIARVMAKRYALEVGPWSEFLPLLRR